MKEVLANTFALLIALVMLSGLALALVAIWRLIQILVS